MRKRYMLSAVGTVGASVVGYLLANKETKSKVKDKLGMVTNKLMNNKNDKDHTILEDAGIPDQVNDSDLAQMENAKMVSEGSQFGVNYYNEVKDEERENNNKK